MQLEPGMQVECIDPINPLVKGQRYKVIAVDSRRPKTVKLEGFGGHYAFFADRFRPVVRVKMGAVYSGKAFDMLVARAVETFGRMSPEQQAAHREEQRESWVRAELELSRLERRQSSRKSPFEP